jgi:tetratricopeptide (TPR) repeat protein
MGWFGDRLEREDAPEEATLPARRRRMLLLSMILVIPLGVLSVGTGMNVVLAYAVGQSYAQGDYAGAAAWARAGVSLNPFDRYLPHYNLGTAYAADDLLPEAVPELQIALDNAPSPEAACYPRANLALTYVRLGNRYFDAAQWRDAVDAYRAAQELWAKQPDDVCHDDPSFEQTAQESSEEAEQGEQDAQEQQQPQPQNPDPTPTPTPDPTASPTPDPSATPTPDPWATPTPGPSQLPAPGPSGTPTPGPDGPGQDGPGQPSSDALGDKLDQLIQQGEAADRERENGGPKQGLADKPW